MTCANCGRQLTCGCQLKTTIDGKSACSMCVGAYNKKAVLDKARITPIKKRIISVNASLVKTHE